MRLQSNAAKEPTQSQEHGLGEPPKSSSCRTSGS